jgi:hypothetical protein
MSSMSSAMISAVRLFERAKPATREKVACDEKDQGRYAQAPQ